VYNLRKMNKFLRHEFEVGGCIPPATWPPTWGSATSILAGLNSTELVIYLSNLERRTGDAVIEAT